MSEKTSPPGYASNGSNGQGQYVVVNTDGCATTSGAPLAIMPVSDFQRVWNLRKHAAPCHCPNCGKTALTSLEYKVGRNTHITAAVFATFLFCCLPYLSTAFKDVHHSCGSCGAKLAIWHGSGRLEILLHDPSMPGGQRVEPPQIIQ